MTYQIFQSVTGKLTWTHYAELLGVSDEKARGFYEKQATKENWSVRELNGKLIRLCSKESCFCFKISIVFA